MAGAEASHQFLSLVGPIDVKDLRRQAVVELAFAEIKRSAPGVHHYGLPQACGRFCNASQHNFGGPLEQRFRDLGLKVEAPIRAAVKLDAGCTLWSEQGETGVMIPVFERPVEVLLEAHGETEEERLLSAIVWDNTQALHLLNKGLRIINGNIRFIYLIYAAAKK
ncbi:hypothetical protein QQS21_011562 [Conoideocrella luteorostrata]|uniref:Uncharacterized protein n=1 Tax=Conoideocrella luteorostrata TaxID=1105319 RepID=A0AAJ0CCW4_9HYPO|nr:hypothetical protein QQS21_011562 [Conoideocrella luteorostrata]